MNVPHVLPRRIRPTEADYRDAIHEIMCAIGVGLTDQELADRLGCSDKTVRNARNKSGSLSPVTLAHIGHEFGPEALQPFADLFDGIMVHASGDSGDLDDILEEGSGFVAKILHFRRGGINHTHERPIREAAKRLQSKVTGFLARIKAGHQARRAA